MRYPYVHLCVLCESTAINQIARPFVQLLPQLTTHTQPSVVTLKGNFVKLTHHFNFQFPICMI